MMDREKLLNDQVRSSGTLLQRLEESRRRIGKMCSEHRGPSMSIPVQWTDDDWFICLTLKDAIAELTAAKCLAMKCPHCKGKGCEQVCCGNPTIENGMEYCCNCPDVDACSTCLGEGSITTIEQYIKTLPADWHADSSLERWFPLTGEQMRLQTEQIKNQARRIEVLESERNLFWDHRDELRKQLRHEISSQENEALIDALQEAAAECALREYAPSWNHTDTSAAGALRSARAAVLVRMLAKAGQPMETGASQ